jgi:hypothetical protein
MAVTVFHMYPCTFIMKRSWDSSAGIAMGYRLESRDLIPGRGKRFFSSPQHPDQFWGPYPMGTTGSIPGNKAAGSMELTIHLHLVLELIMVELYFHSSA